MRPSAKRPRFSTINGFAQAIKVDADVEYENMGAADVQAE